MYVIEYREEKNFFEVLKKLKINYLKNERGKWKFLFFIYISFILQKTLLDRTFGAKNNLKLTLTIPNILEISNTEEKIEAIENLIFFIPYTFFLLQSSLLQKIKRVNDVLVLSFFTSLTIEILQYVTTLGTFQLSDLLYNTLGGIVGYILYKFIEGIRR